MEGFLEPPPGMHRPVVAEIAALDFAQEPNLDADSRTTFTYCWLCARAADCAPVLKGTNTFCSVECAEAVAGLYLG